MKKLNTIHVDIPSMTKVTFESYHNSCYDLIAAKNFKGLLKKIEDDIANEPDNSVYWTMKGYALQELGLKEEALASLNHALQLDINSLYAHSNIAVVLCDLERWEEAIEHCDAILKIDPKNHVNFLKAIALFELERDESAKDCLRKDNESWDEWLRENPDAPKEDIINAYFWLTNNYHTLEEYEQELMYFDKMWELLAQPPPSHAAEYREGLLRLIEKKGKNAIS